MTKLRSVKFNAVMNTLLTASNMIVNLITVPYVTRVLSVEGYGNVTFAQSISTWLSALCLMGVGTYGIRECAKARDNQGELATTVRELLTIVSVCTTVVLSVFAVSIGLVPRLKELDSLMWLFLGSTLLLSYGVEWFFQALEQYRYITIRSILFKTTSLVLTFLLVREPTDWLLYGLLVALVTCGNNILNLIRLVRTVDWSLAGPVNVRRHLKPLMSFACLSIASSVYINLDSVILGFSCPDNYEVGLYQLAVKIKGVTWSVLNAVLAVFIPRLSHYYAVGEKGQFDTLLKKGALFTLNVSVALCGFLAVAGDTVSIFISGPDFAPAAMSVRIIGAVNLFSSLNYFIGLCILTPSGRENQLAIGNLLGVPVSLVLNYTLDPMMGAVGAAISIFVAELLIFIYQFRCIRAMRSMLFPMSNCVKIMVGNMCAIAVTVIVTRMLMGTSILLLVSAQLIAYFITLILMLIATGENLAKMAFQRLGNEPNADA